VFLTDSTFTNEAFEQSAHWIISQGGDDGCVHAETPPQTTSDVVLAAAFPCTKLTRCGNSHVPGIETKHYLTKSYKIPTAFFF
jgi:hypothetical protein